MSCCGPAPTPHSLRALNILPSAGPARSHRRVHAPATEVRMSCRRSRIAALLSVASPRRRVHVWSLSALPPGCRYSPVADELAKVRVDRSRACAAGAYGNGPPVTLPLRGTLEQFPGALDDSRCPAGPALASSDHVPSSAGPAFHVVQCRLARTPSAGLRRVRIVCLAPGGLESTTPYYQRPPFGSYRPTLTQRFGLRRVEVLESGRWQSVRLRRSLVPDARPPSQGRSICGPRAQHQVPGPEPLALDLDRVLVDDRRRARSG
jgi:hypothetical protein